MCKYLQRKHLLGEGCGIMDCKSTAMYLPSHYVLETIAFYICKHKMELAWEVLFALVAMGKIHTVHTGKRGKVKIFVVDLFFGGSRHLSIKVGCCTDFKWKLCSAQEYDSHAVLHASRSNSFVLKYTKSLLIKHKTVLLRERARMLHKRKLLSFIGLVTYAARVIRGMTRKYDDVIPEKCIKFLSRHKWLRNQGGTRNCRYRAKLALRSSILHSFSSFVSSSGENKRRRPPFNCWLLGVVTFS